MNQPASTNGERLERQNAAQILQQRLVEFEQGLQKNIERKASKEEIADLVSFLERRSQTSDRNVEVYTDPNLTTYCCAMVPAKKVLADGSIVEEKLKKTFLIGVPLNHLLGLAPKAFLLGEIQHEQGHARWTDFPMFDKCKQVAEAQGYAPQALFTLMNCWEDTRMERIVGGPMHKPERKLLFEKNSRWVLPTIARTLAQGTPVEQFMMLIKLERLWAIYAKDWADIGIDENDKPWKREELNQDVQRLYAELEPVIAEVSGDAVLPAMRNNEKVEQYLLEKLWPALKQLIDKYPQKKSELEAVEGKNGSGGTVKGDNLKQPAMSGKMPQEDEHYDPQNPDTWPDELKKILQGFVAKHEQKLKQESAQKKEEAERAKIVQGQRDKLKHVMQKRRDGIDSPEARQKYQQYTREVRSQILEMGRVFDVYLPKGSDEDEQYGRQGKSFSVQHYVSRIGSGHEEPMVYEGMPEKRGLVLQILIDVSGSMKEKERIQNAVKACLVALEAAQGREIAIEILASDEQNVSTDSKYIIKAFNEPYNGKVKQRLIEALTAFCDKGNEDAAAILAAIPRMERKMKRVRAETDRMSGLTVFISDSTTQDEKTKAAAEKFRQKNPFEGTAIDPYAQIAAMVRAHFGEKSIIPRSVKEFPQGFKKILERHIRNFRSQQDE